MLFGVIGAIGILFLISVRVDSPVAPSIEMDSAPVSEYVQQCLLEVGTQGIRDLGLSGGFMTYTHQGDEMHMEIPYYWMQGENRMPSIEIIEINLEQYIHEMLPECIGNFEGFPPGVTIEQGVMRPDVHIGTDSVELLLNFPVTITQDSAITTLTEFHTSVTIPFRYYFDTMHIFMAEQERVGNEFPVSFVTALAGERDFVYIYDQLDDNTVILTLHFEDESYTYSFGLKYDWEAEV